EPDHADVARGAARPLDRDRRAAARLGPATDLVVVDERARVSRCRAGARARALRCRTSARARVRRAAGFAPRRRRGTGAIAGRALGFPLCRFHRVLQISRSGECRSLERPPGRRGTRRPSHAVDEVLSLVAEEPVLVSASSITPYAAAVPRSTACG